VRVKSEDTLMISDEEIKSYWRSDNFSGSYRGARTFQLLLKTDLNIDVPLSRIYKVLGEDQIYLIHKQPRRLFKRRKYVVRNYGELTQMDLAVMYPTKEGFKYFLILVDVFSSKIFTEPLKSKSIDELLSAVKSIVSNFKAKIYEIQSDQEPAFVSKRFKDFFKKEKIVFRPKYGKNKASVGKKLFLV